MAVVLAGALMPAVSAAVFPKYYTGYTAGGYKTGSFFRSISPITASYGDANLAEVYNGVPPTSLDIKLSQSTDNGYDLGFYFDSGTLGSLAENGINIAGIGNYGVNLWFNTQDWTWNNDGIFVDLGTDGTYGLGVGPSMQTVDGSAKFYITSPGKNKEYASCNGNIYSIAELASGICAGIGTNTPVAIWVGVGPLGSSGSVSASIPINPKLVFYGIANVINDADSGYNPYNGNNIWAVDSLTRTIKVWQTGVNSFFADVSDVGTANVIAGQMSPGSKAVVEPVSGLATITGKQNVAFTADSASQDAPLFGSPISVYDMQMNSGTGYYFSNGAISEYFPGISNVQSGYNGFNYRYVYNGIYGGTQTWVDSNLVSRENSDDIVVPIPVVISGKSAYDAGQQITLTATVTDYGSSVISYQWYNDGKAIDGATSATYTAAAGTAGTFNYYVSVTDSNNALGNSANYPVGVNDAPSITLSAENSIINLGQSVTFSSNIIGGTDPFTVSLIYKTSVVGNVVGRNDRNVVWTYTPSDVGTLSFSANAVDTAGTPVEFNAPASITVKPVFNGDSTASVNIPANVPLDISFKPADTIVSITSATGATATVAISDVTASTSNMPVNASTAFTKLSVLDISISPNTVNTIVSMGLGSACGSNVAPYKLYNDGTWVELPFAVNSITCTISFSIPPDPVVGLFSYVVTPQGRAPSNGGGGGPTPVSSPTTNSTVTTTSVPITTTVPLAQPSTAPTTTTVPQSPVVQQPTPPPSSATPASGSSDYTTAAAVILLAAVAGILVYFQFMRNRGSAAAGRARK